MGAGQQADQANFRLEVFHCCGQYSHFLSGDPADRISIYDEHGDDDCKRHHHDRQRDIKPVDCMGSTKSRNEYEESIRIRMPEIMKRKSIVF